MGRRRRASRRILVACLALLLLPMGVAHMARGTVASTRAGVASATIGGTTSLVLRHATVDASHAGELQLLGMNAVLRSGRHPLSGATIVFKVAGVTVCVEQTAEDGRVVCPNARFDLDLFESGGDPTAFSYTATFEGVGRHAPSVAASALRVVGGGYAN